jgi:hypothetical protein
VEGVCVLVVPAVPQDIAADEIACAASTVPTALWDGPNAVCILGPIDQASCENTLITPTGTWDSVNGTCIIPGYEDNESFCSLDFDNPGTARNTNFTNDTSITYEYDSYTIYPYKKYVCKKWGVTETLHGVRTVTATFTRVFEP